MSMDGDILSLMAELQQSVGAGVDTMNSIGEGDIMSTLGQQQQKQKTTNFRDEDGAPSTTQSSLYIQMEQSVWYEITQHPVFMKEKALSYNDEEDEEEEESEEDDEQDDEDDDDDLKKKKEEKKKEKFSRKAMEKRIFQKLFPNEQNEEETTGEGEKKEESEGETEGGSLHCISDDNHTRLARKFVSNILEELRQEESQTLAQPLRVPHPSTECIQCIAAIKKNVYATSAWRRLLEEINALPLLHSRPVWVHFCHHFPTARHYILQYIQREIREIQMTGIVETCVFVPLGTFFADFEPEDDNKKKKSEEVAFLTALKAKSKAFLRLLNIFHAHLMECLSVPLFSLFISVLQGKELLSASPSSASAAVGVGKFIPGTVWCCVNDIILDDVFLRSLHEVGKALDAAPLWTDYLVWKSARIADVRQRQQWVRGIYHLMLSTPIQGLDQVRTAYNSFESMARGDNKKIALEDRLEKFFLRVQNSMLPELEKWHAKIDPQFLPRPMLPCIKAFSLDEPNSLEAILQRSSSGSLPLLSSAAAQQAMSCTEVTNTLFGLTEQRVKVRVEDEYNPNPSLMVSEPTASKEESLLAQFSEDIRHWEIWENIISEESVRENPQHPMESAQVKRVALAMKQRLVYFPHVVHCWISLALHYLECSMLTDAKKTLLAALKRHSGHVLLHALYADLMLRHFNDSDTGQKAFKALLHRLLQGLSGFWITLLNSSAAAAENANYSSSTTTLEVGGDGKNIINNSVKESPRQNNNNLNPKIDPDEDILILKKIVLTYLLWMRWSKFAYLDEGTLYMRYVASHAIQQTKLVPLLLRCAKRIHQREEQQQQQRYNFLCSTAKSKNQKEEGISHDWNPSSSSSSSSSSTAGVEVLSLFSHFCAGWMELEIHLAHDFFTAVEIFQGWTHHLIASSALLISQQQPPQKNPAKKKIENNLQQNNMIFRFLPLEVGLTESYFIFAAKVLHGIKQKGGTGGRSTQEEQGSEEASFSPALQAQCRIWRSIQQLQNKINDCFFVTMVESSSNAHRGVPEEEEQEEGKSSTGGASSFLLRSRIRKEKKILNTWYHVHLEFLQHCFEEEYREEEQKKEGGKGDIFFFDRGEKKTPRKEQNGKNKNNNSFFFSSPIMMDFLFHRTHYFDYCLAKDSETELGVLSSLFEEQQQSAKEKAAERDEAEEGRIMAQLKKNSSGGHLEGEDQNEEEEEEEDAKKPWSQRPVYPSSTTTAFSSIHHAQHYSTTRPMASSHSFLETEGEGNAPIASMVVFPDSSKLTKFEMPPKPERRPYQPQRVGGGGFQQQRNLEGTTDTIAFEQRLIATMLREADHNGNDDDNEGEDDENKKELEVKMMDGGGDQRGQRRGRGGGRFGGGGRGRKRGIGAALQEKDFITDLKHTGVLRCLGTFFFSSEDGKKESGVGASQEIAKAIGLDKMALERWEQTEAGGGGGGEPFRKKRRFEESQKAAAASMMTPLESFLCTDQSGATDRIKWLLQYGLPTTHAGWILLPAFVKSHRCDEKEKKNGTNSSETSGKFSLLVKQEKEEEAENEQGREAELQAEEAEQWTLSPSWLVQQLVQCDSFF